MSQQQDFYRIFVTLPSSNVNEIKTSLISFMLSQGINNASFFSGWGLYNGNYQTCMIVVFSTIKNAFTEVQALQLGIDLVTTIDSGCQLINVNKSDSTDL
jgi:hypothetical protein